MIKQFSILFLMIGFLHLNAQSQILFTGKITSASNAPVTNASISVLNSNIHSISDKNGNFKINFPRQGNYQLEINHINFASIHPSIQINKNNNE